MDFDQLRIFLVLAEERTFLGAAKRLDTSRSRVRRKLDRLEAEAGTALLDRGAQGLELTAAGEALVRRGRALLEEAEHLIRHVHDVGTEPSGWLTIAMPYAPPPSGWDQTRRTLLEHYPELRLAFRHADSPVALAPDQAELALTFEEEIPDGFEIRELDAFSLRLVVSPRYADRKGLPAEPDQLDRHRVAVWRRPDRPTDTIPLADGRSIRITPVLTSDDPTSLYRMASRGECIAYLPALPALDDPALKVLFPEQVVGRVRLRLAYPQVFADLPSLRRFVEETTSHDSRRLQSHPGEAPSAG